MLTQIHIRDLATIEKLDLNFLTATTMITGETGAGKSIFIEAIELALGGRTSTGMIRAGKEKAEISLCFDITNFPHVIARLNDLDLIDNPSECIIRRVMTQDGRSRIYLNGSPVTLQLVKELGELLFHLHGQHEQQVLIKTETQRDMLDRYANHLDLTNEVKTLAEQIRHISDTINDMRHQKIDRKDRIDYLEFQLTELNQLNLLSGEWEELETEHHRLTHSEELIRQIQSAINYLSENDNSNVISLLNHAKKNLEPLCNIESKITTWLEVINSVFIQLEDVSAELNEYLSNAEFESDKTQKIEQRISDIYNIARKHKIQPQELLSFYQHLQEEFNKLNAYDDDLIALEKQQQALINTYQKQAEKLSLARAKYAKKLAKEITSTIQSLSLPHGEFQITLEKETHAYSTHGNEKIIFTIKTNPDQSLQPIAKVISGGELSRLSLAVHLALAHQTTIPTLIFDEIDTGLSGATAEKIGKLLRKLGSSYQVFSITHQAQVAAHGHHHLLVEKYFEKSVTFTRLRLLDKKEREREIARLLGGEKITDKTLAHAREVLCGV